MLLQGRAVRHAARRLPSALSIAGVRVEDGLAPLLLPLRRGCEGAVVFQLAEATVQALRERPAALLAEALRPRCPQLSAWRPWRLLHSNPCGLLWWSAQRDTPAWLVLAPGDGVAVYLWRGQKAGCAKLAP